MNAKWKQARKEIRALGVNVNTSYTACCLGCIPEEKITHPKDAPAIYQLAKRWSGEFGGYLCHSNLTEELRLKVFLILVDNGIKTNWDRSQARSIGVEF